MRKIIAALLFIIILCLMGFFGFAQKQDSVKVDSLTATTKFISINDVDKVLSSLEDKITVSQAKTFNAIFQVIVQQLAKEYYEKKEPKK
jgi:hypothetical protein